MRKVYYLIVFLSFFTLASFILAQESDPFSAITYPVSELGNCKSKADCEVFCNKPENMPVCLDFAEAQGLMPEKDIELARKMLALGETEGPGGCRGQAECDSYCDDISHIKECVAFAEKNNLIPPDELAEAKKVAAAIDRGITPPPCNSKSQCDQVCRKPENMKTCIAFAKEAGLMPPEELAEAEKVLSAIEKGATPPPCGGKEECDEYCSAPENLEQCLAFAEAAGFISPEEATMARKTGGKGPGNCRGKEQCEAFCEDPAHGEECINFAVENGFMPAEEAEQAKKMLAAGMNIMQGGPGGCKGKEECETYCDDISHMGECVDFAEKAGMMSAEDAARARKMSEMGMTGGPGGCKGEEECRGFCEDPANGEECLNFAIQIGEMSPEQAEQARQGMEAMMRGGPGGCRGEEECKSYCQDPGHNEECLNFAVESGMMPPEEAERMRGMMEGAREMMEGQMPPEGMMPEGLPPEEFQQQMQERIREETLERMEGGMMPPEGMMPEGMPEGMAPQEFQQQIQQQIQEETQRQIEQQMQQQIQQQMEQQMQQMMPPPSSEPQPTSRRPSLLGTVLAPFIELFLR